MENNGRCFYFFLANEEVQLRGDSGAYWWHHHCEINISLSKCSPFPLYHITIKKFQRDINWTFTQIIMYTFGMIKYINESTSYMTKCQKHYTKTGMQKDNAGIISWYSLWMEYVFPQKRVRKRVSEIWKETAPFTKS